MEKMDDAEKFLVGKTIVKAEVGGYGIKLTFDNNYVFDYDASDGGYSCWEIYKEIDALEQPERKRGKWDTFFSDSYKVHEIGVECSCCGYRTQERTTYCPNCGAEMRKEERRCRDTLMRIC